MGGSGFVAAEFRQFQLGLFELSSINYQVATMPSLARDVAWNLALAFLSMRIPYSMVSSYAAPGSTVERRYMC
jgi:hypothetical protein